MSNMGKIGGKRGSHKNKVRAGHAGMAAMLNNMADKAAATGQLKDAELLKKRAEKHAKLAGTLQPHADQTVARQN